MSLLLYLEHLLVRLRLLASLLEENESQLSKLTAEKTTLEKTLEAKNDDLILLLTLLAELEESKDTLLGELDEIPTIEEEVLVPIDDTAPTQVVEKVAVPQIRLLDPFQVWPATSRI